MQTAGKGKAECCLRGHHVRSGVCMSIPPYFFDPSSLSSPPALLLAGEGPTLCSILQYTYCILNGRRIVLVAASRYEVLFNCTLLLCNLSNAQRLPYKVAG